MTCTHTDFGTCTHTHTRTQTHTLQEAALLLLSVCVDVHALLPALMAPPAPPAQEQPHPLAGRDPSTPGQATAAGVVVEVAEPAPAAAPEGEAVAAGTAEAAEAAAAAAGAPAAAGAAAAEAAAAGAAAAAVDKQQHQPWLEHAPVMALPDAAQLVARAAQQVRVWSPPTFTHHGLVDAGISTPPPHN